MRNYAQSSVIVHMTRFPPSQPNKKHSEKITMLFHFKQAMIICRYRQISATLIFKSLTFLPLMWYTNII